MTDSTILESEKIAVDVVVAFFGYDGGNNHKYVPQSKISKTMIRCIRDYNGNIYNMYVMRAVHAMISERKYTDKKHFFIAIVDEMFDSGAINWGRIIAAYMLIVNVVKEERQKIRFSRIAGKYIGTKIEHWVITNGGWEAFVNKFFVNNFDKWKMYLVIVLLTGMVFMLLSH